MLSVILMRVSHRRRARRLRRAVRGSIVGPSCCWLCGALLALLLAPGCSPPPPSTVRVAGRVTHHGKPVAGAHVAFLNDARGGKSALASTDAEGRYSLVTFFSPTDIPEGAVPGDYSVTIEKRLTPDVERVYRKMTKFRAQGDRVAVERYLKERAVGDLWPSGVPVDWPAGYVPNVTSLPADVIADPVARRRFAKLTQGIPLLPPHYANPITSDLRATVDRHFGEPLTIDFELVGEVETVEIIPRQTADARFDPGGDYEPRLPSAPQPSGPPANQPEG